MKINHRFTALTLIVLGTSLFIELAGCSSKPVGQSTTTRDVAEHDTAAPVTPPPVTTPAPAPSTDATGDRPGDRKVDVQVGGPAGVNVQVGPKTGANNNTTAQ